MLSNIKRRTNADRLQDLNRLGVAMLPEYSPVDKQIPAIVVEQAASDLVCPVIELDDGRTFFLVRVSLWTERPGVRLNGCRFEPPWPDRDFQPYRVSLKTTSARPTFSRVYQTVHEKTF
jgi:hypothetical protein